MTSQWKTKKIITAKSPSLRQTEIIQTLLLSRGLTTKRDQQLFFNPSKPEQLTPESVGIDPKQLSLAVKRINLAIKKKSLIYIYGDYDADGVTATTILWETLHQLKANVMPFIPSRTDETRGLSQTGIEAIIKKAGKKPDLIITVDNGITSFAGAQHAKEQSIDLIITDHHQAEDKLPFANSVVHTTQLAGAGVAWILAHSLSSKTNDLLGVAALGTIADMVSLFKANRSIAKHGLEVLRHTDRPGIKALAKLANLDLNTLKSFQVGYSLAPRLNAMARLDHAIESVRLLCTKNLDQAFALAQSLDSTNQRRQTLTLDLLKAADQDFKKSNQVEKLIFISGKNYHEGIVGLVAGRLAEKYHRPAVVVSIGEKHLKASARSIADFNLVEALQSIKSHLVNFGGHPMAAGFSAEIKNLDIIKTALQDFANKSLKDADLEPTLDIDCQLKFSDLTPALYKEITRFHPFGMDNRSPVFCSLGVTISDIRAVGQEKNHLKLTLKDDQVNFSAIAFNRGYLIEKLSTNDQIKIAFNLDENTFNGNTSLQLKIKDIVKV